MVNVLDTVRGQCADVDPALLDRHFNSLPPSYFERYAAADIARHVRLLAGLSGSNQVDVEVRPLASQAFEVLVVGVNRSGHLACITAALAAYGLDLEDVQVSAYLDTAGEVVDAAAPSYFVVVLRVGGQLRSPSLAEFTAELGERLRVAFAHLSQGNLLEAQTAAAETPAGEGEGGRATPRAGGACPTSRSTGYEGLVFGGDFRLERKLATGGMSEIYLATQVSLNRTVVVKLLRREEAGDDEHLARLGREAAVLAQFSSGHIVQILAAGSRTLEQAGLLGWMAMEYMAGGDLASWLERQGPPPPELGARWLRQALDGLHYAHRHAVLHRDLKPHNLLLTAEGILKVSDFGLLKQAQTVSARLTPRATVLGTPQYMAPEQALGEALDERSDIFSLGTTFFHLLSGRLPFDKTSATALLVQITQEDAPRLAEVAPQVPLPLAVVLQRMMARRREERYQDVEVILADLESYERRGLLTFSDSGRFRAVPPPADARTGEGTDAYAPAQAGRD